MIRQILGVIVGYAIFIISSIFLFKFSEVNPDEEASEFFMVLTFVYGTVFSFISGLVAQLIAKTKNLKVNYLLFFDYGWFCDFFAF